MFRMLGNKVELIRYIVTGKDRKEACISDEHRDEAIQMFGGDCKIEHVNWQPHEWIDGLEFDAYDDVLIALEKGEEAYLAEQEQHQRMSNEQLRADLDSYQQIESRITALTKAAQKLIVIDDLTADELAAMRDIYDAHETDHAYAVGDVFRYGDQLFKVIQAHTSQANWTPSALPALYQKIEPAGVIPAWVQPQGAHDAYKKGDLVTFNGVVYKSKVDGNVWSPPTQWEAQP